jgi:hypothetical protein
MLYKINAKTRISQAKKKFIYFLKDGNIGFDGR